MENQEQVEMAFYRAVQKNQIETVISFLEKHPSLVNAELMMGPTLHVAVKYGYRELAERLLERGADPNQKGGILGGNALNMAASRGQTEMVQLLLEHHAEMDTEEPSRNPLFSAIIEGATESAKILIDAGMDIHVSYTGDVMKNTTALSFAKEWGRAEIVALLEQKLT